ncbi:MAG TPA: DUF2269 family protein [Actinomycetota bacterium]|nr:DUF2269 family protein [Actinomycetota bacterium]
MVFDLVLFSHVALSIVAFGPTFVFPIWLALARRAGPSAPPFAVHAVITIAERLLVPLAILVPATGIALIAETRTDWLHTGWLLASMALYALAFGVATALGLPNARRILALSEGGPDPEAQAEVRRRALWQAVYGYAINLLVLAVLALMVFKPGA